MNMNTAVVLIVVGILIYFLLWPALGAAFALIGCLLLLLQAIA